MFTTLNDGAMVNLVFVSKIYLDGSNVVYENAKGSLQSTVEYFDTTEQATQRYNKLKSELAS